MKTSQLITVTMAALLFSFTACKHEHEITKNMNAEGITNRLHVPAGIANNLGITFERVRRAKVGTWLSAPGKLYVANEQRYTINAPANGRINLKKSLWDEVKVGDIIAELTSSELLAIQEQLVTAYNLLEYANKESKAAKKVLPATKSRAEQAERAFNQKLKTLSVLTGLSEEQLKQQNDNKKPVWQELSKLSIRSPAAGKIVKLETVTGDLVDASAAIAEIIDTSELVFQGSIPAFDVVKFTFPTKARVVPEGFNTVIETSANILPVADEQTLMAIVVAKIKNPEGKLPHGFPAAAQLLIKESAFEEAVLHPDTIVLDGLEHVIFKRDPQNPDYVIRTIVELGHRSENEVEILAGVMEGDEVVRNGVQQLKHTGLGKAPAGGHFHADGTWHEGDK